MSAAKLIPLENRLARLIRRPGGAKVADVLKRADENLESIRADCMTALDRHLEEIGRLRAQSGRKASIEVKDAIYRLGNDIHGVAGVFGLTELGEAAFSLCELADRLRLSDRWSQAAVDVHISALRLLRHPEGAGDSARVLAGLRQVVERFPKPVAEQEA